jgi:predicted transcriptional regulator
MPQVLLVDSKGTVQWSHVGEFAPVDVSKVLSMIGHD